MSITRITAQLAEKAVFLDARGQNLSAKLPLAAYNQKPVKIPLVECTQKPRQNSLLVVNEGTWCPEVPIGIAMLH